MSKEEYAHTHLNKEYVGKHAPKQYQVWRVLGPAGPEETIYVEGLKKANELTMGCWDWEVRNSETGEYIKDEVLRRYQ